jgi:hypothetical protein
MLLFEFAMQKAPIAFFAYKRADHTLQALESLAENDEAKQSELFIFCDAPKHAEDWTSVEQVRKIVRSRQWCGKVRIIERKENLGLARSIISGVTELCDKFGRVIVLEDDLLLSPQFLNYMNDALSKYADRPRVMHIAGYMYPVQRELSETVFIRHPTCWGWATWQRAWQYFEPDAARLATKLRQKRAEKEFSFRGSYPYMGMLERQERGELNSWAIRWYASVFLNQGLCLHPGRSLVNNIGFDGTGDNCGTMSAFKVEVSKDQITTFSEILEEEPETMDAIVEFFHRLNPPNPIPVRIWKKFKRLF